MYEHASKFYQKWQQMGYTVSDLRPNRIIKVNYFDKDAFEVLIAFKTFAHFSNLYQRLKKECDLSDGNLNMKQSGRFEIVHKDKKTRHMIFETYLTLLDLQHVIVDVTRYFFFSLQSYEIQDFQIV